jgi:hypothetical protein
MQHRLIMTFMVMLVAIVISTIVRNGRGLIKLFLRLRHRDCPLLLLLLLMMMTVHLHYHRHHQWASF